MSQAQNQSSNQYINSSSTNSNNSIYITTTPAYTNSSTVYYSDPWSREYSFKEDGLYHVMRDDEKVVDCLNYLSEVELMSILDNMLAKGCDHDNFKILLRLLLESRHFSEEFLLNFYEYTTPNIIKIKHLADIKSQAYPSIALMVQSEEVDNAN